MKKVTYQTFALLTLFSANVLAANVVLADESATTPAEVAFLYDDTPVTPPVTEPNKPTGPYNTGDLAIAGVPAEFNFGLSKISAKDTVSEYTIEQKDYLSAENSKDDSAKKRYPATGEQGVMVYDGRVQNDDWMLYMSFSSFTSSGGEKLKGARLSTGTTKWINLDTNPTAPSQAESKMMSENTTYEIMKSNEFNPKAKGHSEVRFGKYNQTRLIIPGDELKYGTYQSTITYTLAGTPDA